MGCCASTAKDGKETFTDITAEESPKSALNATEQPASQAATEHSRSRRDRQLTRKPQETRARKGAWHAHSPVSLVYDASKWTYIEMLFGGRSTSVDRVEEEVRGPIEEGIAKLKADPQRYLAITYQSSMTAWPAKKQKYTLLVRAGTKGYAPDGVTTDPQVGWMTLILAKYHALPPLADLGEARDAHTDAMTYRGAPLHTAGNAPLMPGRGDGVCDAPGLKIIGDVDPHDVHQGHVGNCWLLSGISSLAEFDGAVHRLFRKTDGLDWMPKEAPNSYTVTLWDLPTMREVDVVVDERLARHPTGNGLLGCQPSNDHELWVCYLEKALAVHCGGWDMINGGHCTHAWALLTGCREQCTIKRNPKTGGFKCWGTYNPNEERWETLGNSPKEGFRGLWPMKWPEVGGGGAIGSEIDEEELFMKMCAWDDQNYIMGAGTKSGSDKNSTDGLVDGHAYSVIEVVNDVADTEFDMIKMRNPWGAGGELEDNYWGDHGQGWTDHPEITDALKPTHADDGIFWVCKQDFFRYYHTIYISCSDMTRFLEDAPQPVGGYGKNY